MLFYEYVLPLPGGKSPELPRNPTLSKRGRKKENLILVIEAEQGVLRLCQFCAGPEEGEQELERFCRTYGLERSQMTRRELTVTELEYMLRRSPLVKSSQVMQYFRLTDYFSPPICAEICEMRAEYHTYMLEDPVQNKGCRGSLDDALERIRTQTLAQKSGFPGVYALEVAERTHGETEAERLMYVLHDAGRLPSERICVLQPQEYALTHKVLDNLYHAQSGATMLIMLDLEEGKVPSSIFQNVCRIGEAAMRYMDSVLTVIVATPWAVSLLNYLGDQLPLLPLERFRSKTVSFRALLEDTVAQRSRMAQLCIPKEKRAQLFKTEPDALQELEQLIGLTEVKQLIRQAADYGRARKLYEERGFKPLKLGMHMVFSGDPGTAKTTAARLVARIFQEQGVLPRGELIEVGRSDLVGRYSGWTAQQVKDLFERAKGSVLFVDEAYALLEDKEGQFGDEAINTLVQEMENHRHDTVVILAGYQRPMEQLLDRNPGLRSRITFRLEFPNYSEAELMQIFHKLLAEHERSLRPEDEPHIQSLIRAGMKQENFGNGRFVRNLVEQAILAQASRLMQQPAEQITDEDIRCFRPEDFRMLRQQKPVVEKRVIGFAPSP